MKKQAKPSKEPRPAAEAKAGAASGKTQAQLFSEAMSAFWAGKYDRAIGLFEQAAQGKDLSVAESAQMHIRMCRRRMEGAQPDLQTPEQQHLYAVSLINEQRFEEALPWLEKAVKGDPRPEYRYTLALALGRAGRIEEAAGVLRQAVESDGDLRKAAKNDPDFAPLLENPHIRQVIEPAQPAL